MSRGTLHGVPLHCLRNQADADYTSDCIQYANRCFVLAGAVPIGIVGVLWSMMCILGPDPPPGRQRLQGPIAWPKNMAFEGSFSHGISYFPSYPRQAGHQ